MAEEYGIFSSSFQSSLLRERATPLSAVAGAFEEMARVVKNSSSNKEELRLSTFCDACSLVSVLFSFLRMAFKFAEFEHVSK